ncbi:MAG: acetyltransferase [Magnetospirillum sp.]|nr:acetyltransferase [Magnetospirillum sp.]
MVSGIVSVVIAGAGGLGREVAVYVQDAIAAGTMNARLRGFLDDTDADPAALGIEAPVLGSIDTYVPQAGDAVLVAVGAPADRLAVAARLVRRGARFATLIHPLAYVARPSTLAEGTIVAPFATVGVNASLGGHCLVNTHAGIGHDAVLGPCCVISPHGIVNGNVTLGQGVLLGSSAVVTPGRTLADGVKVSAGSVVQSDLAAGVTVWGNPARQLPT